MTTLWQPPILRGSRLILRPVQESDAAAVFTYASNPNVTAHTLFDTHRELTDSLSFVREYTRTYYRDHVPDPMAIVLSKDPDGPLIGTIGCHWDSRQHRVMEIGFTIGEAHWGQGFATEAGHMLIDHVFTVYPVERVQARAMVENLASSRVLEKLGMSHEGTLRHALLVRGRFRDTHMYSILRDEWEANSDTPRLHPERVDTGRI